MTSLEKGVPTLKVETQVCKEGEKLSGEKARLLLMLGYMQAVSTPAFHKPPSDLLASIADFSVFDNVCRPSKSSSGRIGRKRAGSSRVTISAPTPSSASRQTTRTWLRHA